MRPPKDKPVVRVSVGEYHYSLVERVMVGSGGVPVCREGVTRFLHSLLGEAIEGLAERELGLGRDSGEGLWWRLHGYWVGVCGLTPARKSVNADEGLVGRMVTEYGIDGVIGAMDNYNKMLKRPDRYVGVERMEFDEFMARGVGLFNLGADPFNRHCRVTASDYRKLVREPVKRIGNIKMDVKELDKLRQIMERRTGKYSLGKDV